MFNPNNPTIEKFSVSRRCADLKSVFCQFEFLFNIYNGLIIFFNKNELGAIVKNRNLCDKKIN